MTRPNKVRKSPHRSTRDVGSREFIIILGISRREVKNLMLYGFREDLVLCRLRGGLRNHGSTDTVVLRLKFGFLMFWCSFVSICIRAYLSFY